MTVTTIKMNKYLAIVLLILLASCHDRGGFPAIVKNTITAKHANIPGTRLYLVPPPGFSNAAGYMGMRRSSAVLQVYDLTDGNFFSSTAIYNKDKFERQGAQIIDYKDVVVDGYKGKYIYMINNDNTSVYTLVFGDSTFCTTVLGIFSEEDKEAAKDLKLALQSVAYDVHKKIDPFSRATFSVNDTASVFKFLKVTGSAFIYTANGVEMTFNGDDSYVIISSQNSELTQQLPTLADTIFKRIEEEHGMTEKDIKNAAEVKTFDYPAYEREVYGMANGKLTLLYELALIRDKNLVIFSGHCKSDFSTNLDAFKKLSRTISLK